MSLTVRARGNRFVDGHGRHVILRGVNLGGDCKMPYPGGGTDQPSDFADHRTVSFIGRPFPLEEADTHLARIAGWGFNTLRLLTTWEAVEHAGPGDYDEAYLDYFAEVVRRAGAHGLQVFVDFHQDVWSRMSGGDGAPGWVWEALGIDFTRFFDSRAALSMQASYDYADPTPRQEANFPMMSWSRNYGRAANAIAWTAFFAGEAFTPSWTIDGRNVQRFLQDHYLGAVRAVAQRLAGEPNVIGFDSLNEPGSGWIGQRLSERLVAPTPERPRVRPGAAFSPLDALKSARGVPVTVPVLAFTGGRTPEIVGEEAAGAVSIWLDGPDPFERAGVWRASDGAALNEDAFRTTADGRPFELERDGMAPFFTRVAETIRAVRPDWLLFAELDPGNGFDHGFPEGTPAGTVNASHWYDIRTLGTKRFSTDDPDRLRETYARQLGRIRDVGDRMDAPSLIGEFGIPYDLNGAGAYAGYAAGERGRALWADHEQTLSLQYDAMDVLLLNSTQWNYTASNRNDLRVGDGWNQEDLSIWSADQAEDFDGGRAVHGFCRPYVQAAQGTLTFMRFNAGDGLFEAEIDADPAVDAPTELYVPALQYPDGFDVVGDADVETTGERVRIRARSAGPLRIAVRPRA